MAKPNQYNQQFEKHHIATLRKWASARGITQARWRSKALQLMVEEAGVEQSIASQQLLPLVERIRQVALDRLDSDMSSMSTQDIVAMALTAWVNHLSTFRNT
jgi:hypothetical protein